jgi:hypothetical protein
MSIRRTRRTRLRLPSLTEGKKELESGGFEQALLALVDKAAGKAEDSKGSSFPVYLILTGLVMLGFAISGWLAVRARRRSAQLEYELRKKHEEQLEAVERATLIISADMRSSAESKVQVLSSEIRQLQLKITENSSKSADRAVMLAQATSWSDLVIVDKRK